MAIRVVNVDGEPWFIAGDVAKALGYSATAAMMRSVEADQKGVQSSHTPGGTQSVTTISEAGFYRLILRAEAIRPEVKALGYSHTPHMVRMVDGDEKGVHQTDTPGGMQSLTTISESGFYKLILRAEALRPEVKAFQDWVTRIVLPSIRKTGGYVVGQERAQSPEGLEGPPRLPLRRGLA